MLNEASRLHPQSWWWIKADACDLVSGLGTSVEGKWSGDVNLHIEELELLYEEYKKRIQFLKSLDEKDSGDLLTSLSYAKENLIIDVTFIDSSELQLSACFCELILPVISPCSSSSF